MQPIYWGSELCPALEASNHHLLVRGHRKLHVQAWPTAAATRGSALSFAAMAGAAPGASFVTHPAATYPVRESSQNCTAPASGDGRSSRHGRQQQQRQR